jgi:hypothetical protein
MIDEWKPLWPWIVALLIGLPVLYVASFGPACWLTDHEIVPAALSHTVFSPLARAAVRCPTPIKDALIYYSEIGGPELELPGIGWWIIEYEELRLRRRMRA